jgi:polyhydroxyalkanoate synthesis regulator phasin
MKMMNNNDSSSRAAHPSRRSGANRGVAAGLTLGVIGGTAAGLVFGVPGLTSAASGDVAVSPAAIVQQVDDTDPAAPTEEAPAEVGTRLRETLQPLVDDGTVTADQADAVTSHLIENRPDRDERRENREGRREARQAPEAVQELLDLSPEELREQLRAGSTLGDIATEQGIDPQDVVDAIVAEMTERVEAAVADGKLDADAAAEKLADAQERISDRVLNGRPDRPSDD